MADLTITRGARLAAVGLLILTLLVGAGNLWASWDEVHAYKAQQQQEQAAQERQGREIETKLCTTFGRLAALKPPPGNPKANPSRAYEQQEHVTLEQLGTDIGCGKKAM
jgi:hypothetical protein